jgi:hypothetical protein
MVNTTNKQKNLNRNAEQIDKHNQAFGDGAEKQKSREWVESWRARQMKETTQRVDEVLSESSNEQPGDDLSDYDLLDLARSFNAKKKQNFSEHQDPNGKIYKLIFKDGSPVVARGEDGAIYRVVLTNSGSRIKELKKLDADQINSVNTNGTNMEGLDDRKILDIINSGTPTQYADSNGNELDIYHQGGRIVAARGVKGRLNGKDVEGKSFRAIVNNKGVVKGWEEVNSKSAPGSKNVEYQPEPETANSAGQNSDDDTIGENAKRRRFKRHDRKSPFRPINNGRTESEEHDITESTPGDYRIPSKPRERDNTVQDGPETNGLTGVSPVELGPTPEESELISTERPPRQSSPSEPISIEARKTSINPRLLEQHAERLAASEVSKKGFFGRMINKLFGSRQRDNLKTKYRAMLSSPTQIGQGKQAVRSSLQSLASASGIYTFNIDASILDMRNQIEAHHNGLGKWAKFRNRGKRKKMLKELDQLKKFQTAEMEIQGHKNRATEVVRNQVEATEDNPLERITLDNQKRSAIRNYLQAVIPSRRYSGQEASNTDREAQLPNARISGDQLMSALFTEDQRAMINGPAFRAALKRLLLVRAEDGYTINENALDGLNEIQLPVFQAPEVALEVEDKKVFGDIIRRHPLATNIASGALIVGTGLLTFPMVGPAGALAAATAVSIARSRPAYRQVANEGQRMEAEGINGLSGYVPVWKRLLMLQSRLAAGTPINKAQAGLFSEVDDVDGINNLGLRELAAILNPKSRKNKIALNLARLLDQNETEFDGQQIEDMITNLDIRGQVNHYQNLTNNQQILSQEADEDELRLLISLDSNVHTRMHLAAEIYALLKKQEEYKSNFLKANNATGQFANVEASMSLLQKRLMAMLGVTSWQQVEAELRSSEDLDVNAALGRADKLFNDFEKHTRDNVNIAGGFSGLITLAIMGSVNALAGDLGAFKDTDVIDRVSVEAKDIVVRDAINRPDSLKTLVTDVFSDNRIGSAQVDLFLDNAKDFNGGSPLETETLWQLLDASGINPDKIVAVKDQILTAIARDPRAIETLLQGIDPSISTNADLASFINNDPALRSHLIRHLGEKGIANLNPGSFDANLFNDVLLKAETAAYLLKDPGSTWYQLLVKEGVLIPAETTTIPAASTVITSEFIRKFLIPLMASDALGSARSRKTRPVSRIRQADESQESAAFIDSDTGEEPLLEGEEGLIYGDDNNVDSSLISQSELDNLNRDLGSVIEGDVSYEEKSAAIVRLKELILDAIRDQDTSSQLSLIYLGFAHWLGKSGQTFSVDQLSSEQVQSLYNQYLDEIINVQASEEVTRFLESNQGQARNYLSDERRSDIDINLVGVFLEHSDTFLETIFTIFITANPDLINNEDRIKTEYSNLVNSTASVLRTREENMQLIPPAADVDAYRVLLNYEEIDPRVLDFEETDLDDWDLRPANY